MPRRTSAHAIGSLRELFTGANIREIIGWRDTGEIRVAKAHNPDGGDLVDHDGNADLWVHHVDAMTDHPGVSALHIPGGILFAQPVDNDTVLILRAGDVGGPGVGIMLHWDGGDANRIPAWSYASPPKDGLYTARVLRLESSGADVEVVPPSGHKVFVGAGSGGGTQPAVLGNDLNAYLQTIEAMLNDLKTQFNQLRADYNALATANCVNGSPVTFLPAHWPTTATAIGESNIANPPALAANVEVK